MLLSGWSGCRAVSAAVRPLCAVGLSGSCQAVTLGPDSDGAPRLSDSAVRLSDTCCQTVGESAVSAVRLSGAVRGLLSVCQTRAQKIVVAVVCAVPASSSCERYFVSFFTPTYMNVYTTLPTYRRRHTTSARRSHAPWCAPARASGRGSRPQRERQAAAEESAGGAAWAAGEAWTPRLDFGQARRSACLRCFSPLGAPNSFLGAFFLS